MFLFLIKYILFNCKSILNNVHIHILKKCILILLLILTDYKYYIHNTHTIFFLNMIIKAVEIENK